MKPPAGVYLVVATFVVVAMATGLGTGTAVAALGAQKTVPLKVVVLIHAKTKGVSEGAKIKQIETLKEAAAAKKNLGQVQEKDGKEVKRLNGTYVVKDARVTLAEGGVVECQVLVAIEPGKTILRDVNFVSTLRSTRDKEAGTWYGYTAVFDTAAPDSPTPAGTVRPRSPPGVAQAGDRDGLRWPVFRLPPGLEGERQVRRQVTVVGPERVDIDLRQRVVAVSPRAGRTRSSWSFSLSGRVTIPVGCSRTAGPPLSSSIYNDPMPHLLDGAARPSYTDPFFSPCS
jgi:hypothetical protein